MNVAPRIKTESVHFRVSREDRQRLERVAAARGQSASDVVRELIAEEDLRITLEARD